MGEAFGDFLGGAISEKMSNFQSDCVGDWDGASYSQGNPPCLRRLDGTKHYPEDLKGSYHADGEIWSAALWQIYNGMSQKDDAVKLVLAHHFLLSPGAKMPQAAEALLAADQNLFQGANQGLIKQVMEARGILEITGEFKIKMANRHGHPIAGKVLLEGPENFALEVPYMTGTVTRHLPPGEYTMKLSSYGFVSPNVRTFTLSPESPSHFDYRLNFAPDGTLSGIVHSDGEPVVAKLEVLDTPLDPVLSSSNGSYYIEAPQGVYTLKVSASGYATRTLPNVVISGQGFKIDLAKLPPILLVDEDSSSTGTQAEFEKYFEQALIDSGHADYMVVKPGDPLLLDLVPFEAVVWMSGSRTSKNLNLPAQRAAIEAYLESGGRFILSGQDLGFGLRTHDWLKAVLGVEYIKDKADMKNILGSGMDFLLGGEESADNQGFPDVLAAHGDSSVWLQYGDQTGAAIAHDQGAGRVVFLGFGLEGVRTAAKRAELMQACFDISNENSMQRKTLSREWFQR